MSIIAVTCPVTLANQLVNDIISHCRHFSAIFRTLSSHSRICAGAVSNNARQLGLAAYDKTELIV